MTLVARRRCRSVDRVTLVLPSRASTSRADAVAGAARQREFAIRTAVGGSRRRLVRQVYRERGCGRRRQCPRSSPWFLAGGPRARRGTPTLPRLGEVAIDGRVMALSASRRCSPCSPPAWHRRSARHASIHQYSRRESRLRHRFPWRPGSPWRDSLLVIEAALAIVLIVGACLWFAAPCAWSPSTTGIRRRACRSQPSSCETRRATPDRPVHRPGPRARASPAVWRPRAPSR